MLGRGRQLSGNRLALGCGVAAMLFSLVFQSPGVVLSPDGWAYWEGSVSILRGEGYRYLDGPPIGAWPPGFPVYLALWQAVFGVSAGTIAWAHAVAIGAAAGFWVAVAMRVVPAREFPLQACAAAATLTFLIPISLRAVLSESLFMAWLGAALLVAVDRRADADARPATGSSIARFTILALLLFGMLSTRHAGIAFLPALAWLSWRSVPPLLTRSRTLVTAAFVVAVVAWAAAALALGALGNNARVPLDAELVERAAANGRANLAAIASVLWPTSAAGAIAAGLLAISATLWPELGRVRRSPSEPAAAVAAVPGLATATLLASACAAVVWAAHDVRGARIVLPVAAMAVLLLANTGARGPSRRRQRMAAAVLVAVAAVQVARAGFWIRHALGTESEGLSWSSAPAPPDYPWIEREGSEASPRSIGSGGDSR